MIRSVLFWKSGCCMMVKSGSIRTYRKTSGIGCGIISILTIISAGISAAVLRRSYCLRRRNATPDLAAALPEMCFYEKVGFMKE